MKEDAKSIINLLDRIAVGVYLLQLRVCVVQQFHRPGRHRILIPSEFLEQLLLLVVCEVLLDETVLVHQGKETVPFHRFGVPAVMFARHELILASRVQSLTDFLDPGRQLLFALIVRSNAILSLSELWLRLGSRLVMNILVLPFPAVLQIFKEKVLPLKEQIVSPLLSGRLQILESTDVLEVFVFILAL
jgi:hypothetical protein